MNLNFTSTSSLLQKQVILTRESNQNRPHLERCKENHHVNLDKLI